MQSSQYSQRKEIPPHRESNGVSSSNDVINKTHISQIPWELSISNLQVSFILCLVPFIKNFVTKPYH